ncbi:MAG: hypothetical protein JXA14_02995 [Anaerolineae bacterium]|nr:hypothetical protein [Anaerolineae bacterium]
MTGVQQEKARKPRRHPASLFWPIVIIGAGVALLLSNLGYLPWASWNIMWRLWPLLLIALGIDLLIGRRSIFGAIVSAILIAALVGGAVALAFFAPSIPQLAELTQSPEWRTTHVEQALEGVERASVTIDTGSVPCVLSELSDSPNLIEGDITYRGTLIFDAPVRGGRANVRLDSYFAGPWWGWSPDFGAAPDAAWDVKLSPKVPLDLNLDTGSGHCDFDLSGLQINNLVVDSGSGAVDLTLPADSSFKGTIDAGSGRVAITLPTGVGARVVLDSGSGAFRPDERFEMVSGERGDDSVWETENYDTAKVTIELKIDQGSGALVIEK